MSRNPSRSARTVARGLAVCTPVHAGFRPAAAALAVAAVFALQSGGAAAQPVGANVIAGQASFVRNGNDLTITTQNAAGTSHSAINWQSFSVPAGSVTQFNQPSASSTSINRVTGPDPSAIFGTLRSNGNLVLVNPAGIAVGTGAVVDTAGFTASTLQMSETDAIAGRLRFSNQGTSGALTVGGTIRAQGGDIVLVAPNVQTTREALIQSDGATVLAAGQKVEISGRGLEGIHLDVQAGNQAVNLGTLQGDAVGIFAGTLRHSGLVQAQAVTTQGGKVVLQATGGDALVNGTIEARALEGKGGGIDVLGARVGLFAGAALDASGASGGGQVRVGGDYQGSNAAVPNAARTYVDADATIRADATQQGDGGRVIVWSDEATRMQGQISARGAGVGGNGGFSEVSGKKGLEFTGWVDLRAPQGHAGSLLLDPEDVTIVHDVPLLQGTLPPVYNSVNTFPANLDLGLGIVTTAFAPSSALPVTLSDAQLNAQLAVGDVMVTTSSPLSANSKGNIKVDEAALVTWSTGSHLALRADKGIEIEGRIIAIDPSAALHLRALNGSITQSATGSIVVPSLYAWATGNGVSDGNVTLTSNSNVVGTIAGQADKQFTFANSGSFTVGSVSNPFSSDIGGGSEIVASGDVSLASAGILSVEGTGISTRGSLSLNGTDVHIANLGTGDTTVSANKDITITANNAIAAGQRRGEVASTVSIEAGGLLKMQSGAGGLSFGEPLVTTDVANAPARVQLQGGSVDLQAGRGSAHFSVDTTTEAFGGTIDVVAGGNITGGGSFFTQGRPAADSTTGAIKLQAGGTLDFGAIDASGSSVFGPHAGNITLAATGAITGGSVSARGSFFGTENGSGAAGNGGAIQVSTSAGNISIGSLDADAGSTFSDFVAPGAAGSVSLLAGTPLGGALVDLDVGHINVQGGTGSIGTAGGSVTLGATGSINLRGTEGYAILATGGSGLGAGGHGGSVSVNAGLDVSLGGQAVLENTNPFSLFLGGLAVNAQGGSGSIGGHGGDIALGFGRRYAMGTMTAGGGAGRDGHGPVDGAAAVLNGGTGGAGGTVTIRGSNGDLNIDFFSSVEAHGGRGGSAASDGLGHSGTAGAGGAGGSVTLLTPAGNINLAGEVGAGGGLGGLAVDGTRAASGTFGTLELNAGGNIDTTDSLIDALRSNVTMRARGNITLASSLTTAGGGVTVSAGDAQAGSGVATPLPVAANAALSVQANIDASGEGSAPGGAVTLHASGSVAVDAKIPVFTTSPGTTALVATSPSALGGTVAGLSVDIAAPRVNVAATTGIVGQQVFVTADSLALDGSITSSGDFARTVLAPFSSTRAIRLGGTDTGTTLHLSQEELGHIQSPLLTIGSFTSNGGIRTDGPVTLDESLVPILNLASGGAITQGAGSTLTVGSLAVQGSSVLLDQVAIAHTLAGRSLAGGFEVDNLSTGTLSVGGLIAGTSGILGPSGNSPVLITSKGRLRLDGVVQSSAAGNAVVLSGSSFEMGQGGINTPAGRWLVYLPGPDGSQFANQFAKLDSGNLALWNRSFDGAPPATITQGGNRYVFALQPQATIAGGSATKVYDGTPDLLGLTPTASGLIDPARFGNVFLPDTLTGTYGSAGLSKNVGTYALTQGTLGIAGYATNFTGGTLTITPRPLNVAITARDKVYDGTTAATVTASADNGIAGDQLTLTVSGRFADKNVGSAKTVSVDASLSGADAGNYLLGLPTQPQTASITARTLHLSASAKDKVYDGGAGASVSLSGDGIAGDSLAVSANAAFSDRNAANDKSVAVNLGALSGSDAGNYVLAQSVLTTHASITPRPLHVVLGAQDKVYDGTTAATVATADDRIAGDALSVGASASFADRNAGANKAVTATLTSLSGADAGNYTLSAVPTLTFASITPRPLNVTLTPQNKVYDGNTTATVASGDNRIAGDQLTVAVNGRFADKNVGTAKTLSVDALLLGADAGNYVLTLPTQAQTAAITPRTLNVSASAQDKVYDGGVNASVNLGDDRIAGDSFTLAANAAFSDRNAGAGKSVTVALGGLAGSDAGNYVLAQPALATHASITPASLVITASDATKLEGDPLRFKGNEFTTSGLVGSETVATVTLASDGADAAAKANRYAITPSAAVGGSGFLASNYDISYRNGVLTVVSPASPAAIQVNNQVVTFAQLFVQESVRQQQDDLKKGKDDIVVTDTACKPS